jgi:hypothetical protein
MKTSELTGAALDWAVAICEHNVGWEPEGEDRDFYSTDWAQGGPIIEREGLSMRYAPKDARGAWYAVQGPNRFLSPDHEGSGPTPLIAACRCFVASKLGDDIDIPEELL